MSRLSQTDLRQRMQLQQLTTDVRALQAPTNNALARLGQGASVWIPRLVGWQELQAAGGLTALLPMAMVPAGSWVHDVVMVIEEPFVDGASTMAVLQASLFSEAMTDPPTSLFQCAGNFVFSLLGAAKNAFFYWSVGFNGPGATLNWSDSMMLRAEITTDTDFANLTAGSVWLGFLVSQPKAYGRKVVDANRKAAAATTAAGSSGDFADAPFADILPSDDGGSTIAEN